MNKSTMFWVATSLHYQSVGKVSNRCALQILVRSNKTSRYFSPAGEIFAIFGYISAHIPFFSYYRVWKYTGIFRWRDLLTLEQDMLNFFIFFLCLSFILFSSTFILNSLDCMLWQWERTNCCNVNKAPKIWNRTREWERDKLYTERVRHLTVHFRLSFGEQIHPDRERGRAELSSFAFGGKSQCVYACVWTRRWMTLKINACGLLCSGLPLHEAHYHDIRTEGTNIPSLWRG